jgi:hypothetical protein
MASEPVFLPWIGSKFPLATEKRFRLLVLGESHYGDPFISNPGLTKWVVEHHANGIQREPFFTKWSNLLSNRPAFSGIGPAEIFESIAFYNFIQRVVGLHHNDRPTKDDWKNACDPFIAVLDRVRPHAVLVLGMETWNHIRFPDGTVSEPDISDRQRIWTRPDGWRIAASSVNHPQSHGFAAHEWQPFVDDLLLRGMKQLEME